MNQKGLATASFLLLLPLVLAILVTLMAAFYLLKDEGQSRHVCRTTALAMQEKVAERLNTLVGMNDQAQSLRVDREAADQAVQNSAGVPYLEAIALANQSRVIAEQMAFAASQQTIIADARRAAWLARAELRAKLNATLQLQSQIQASSASTALETLTAADAEVTINLPEFAVEASPQDSLSPDYQPTDDFSKREALHVHWRLRLAQLLPNWMQDILQRGGQDPHLDIDLGCGATVVAASDDNGTDSGESSPSLSSGLSSSFSSALNQFGGQKWIAKLNQDR